jgi:peptide-methionine (R)-S-oxide reductase
MTTRRNFLSLLSYSALAATGGYLLSAPQSRAETFRVSYSDEKWREILSADQYAVLRQEGTEPPFTSPLLHEKRAGDFLCAGCTLPLFSSTTKYDSGTGWPSFWAPLDGAVGTTDDTSLGMTRTEVHCAQCGGHLGHVFTDGPQPTGLRYCMNGLALSFKPSSA